MKTRSLLQMKLIGIAAIIMLLAASCTGITSLYSPTAPPTLVLTPTPTEAPIGTSTHNRASISRSGYCLHPGRDFPDGQPERGSQRQAG